MENKKKTDTEAENQRAIISNYMAKLKDQCNAIKRDVSNCMLLVESQKDLIYEYML